MLYLTSAPNSIRWHDLTEREQKHIEENASGQCTQMLILRENFCSIISYKRRTITKGKNKTQTLFVKEMLRWEPLTDNFYTCDYVYCIRCGGGYMTLFDIADYANHFRLTIENAKKDNPGYWPGYELFHEGNKEWTYNFKIWCTHAFTLQEWVEWVRRYIPYFDCKEENATYQLPWQLMKKYKENLPASELFFKAGMYRLGLSKRMTHLKPQKRKLVLQKLRQLNIDEARWVNISEFLNCAASGKTEKQYKTERALRNIRKRAVEEGVKEYIGKTKDVLEYLLKHGANIDDIIATKKYTIYGELREYLKYIKDLVYLGFELNKGALYPRDYETSRTQVTRMADEIRWERARAEAERNRLEHERLEAERREKELKEKRESQPKIKEVAELLGIGQYEGVTIRPLSSSQEFIQMGNYFSNCVGRCGYDLKMAKRQTYVCIVYVGDTPTTCCEIDYKTRQIRQEYGKDNKVPDQDYFTNIHPYLVDYITTRNYEIRP